MPLEATTEKGKKKNQTEKGHLKLSTCDCWLHALHLFLIPGILCLTQHKWDNSLLSFLHNTLNKRCYEQVILNRYANQFCH